MVEKKEYKVNDFKGSNFQVVILDYADEPMPNVKCNVTFQNGQTIKIETDDKGVLKFPLKAKGDVEIELIEEETEEDTGDAA